MEGDKTIGPSDGCSSSASSNPAGAPGLCAFLVQTTNLNGPVGIDGRAGSVIPSGTPVTVRQCAGCKTDIYDRYLLYALDRYWHTTCLKCSLCQVQLEEVGSSCFTREGMILCKADYIKLFGLTGCCAGCGQSIPPNELVLKVQGGVYHVNCFTCATCHNRLVAGDRYRFVNGDIVCEQDYPKVVRGGFLQQQQQQQQQSSSHRTRHKVKVC